jgi:hypothetical protein
MLTIHNEHWEEKTDAISANIFGSHNGVGTCRRYSNSGKTRRGGGSPNASSTSFDDGNYGFRRWFRDSREIHSGRRSNIASIHLDQYASRYDELSSAHA